MFVKIYFDSFTYKDDFNFNAKIAVIQPFPYVPIEQIHELHYSKQEDAKEALFDMSEESSRRPTVMSISSVALDMTSGTKESLKFLASLKDSDADSQFESKFVQTYLDYKMKQTAWISYIQMTLYLAYLLTNFVKHMWYSVAPWCVYQIAEEIVQLIGNQKASGEKWNIRSAFSTAYDSMDIWNFADYLRIILQISFIVVSFCSTPDPDQLGPADVFFAYLIMVSWLSFLKYLRMFESLRIFIKLFIECC